MKHNEKNSAILMFVVFFLTFLVLWSMADLVSRLENQNRGNRVYESEKRVNILCDKVSGWMEDGKEKKAERYMADLLARISNIAAAQDECGVTLTDLFLDIKQKRDTVRGKIVLREMEPSPYEMQERMDPSAPLLIGESLREYLVKQDGKLCLWLDDELCPVGGVLKNYGVSGQDERIFILYENLTDSGKKRLLGWLAAYYASNMNERYGVRIDVGSDSKGAVSDTLEKLTDENNIAFQIYPLDEKETPGVLNEWYEMYHSLFGGLSLLFAVLCGIAVSNLWFSRRQREYMIRLTFGYSRAKIWRMIGSELGKISLCSLAASACLRIVYLVWKRNAVSGGSAASVRMMAVQGAVMLLGAAAVLFLTTLYPLIRLMSLDPAEGLRRYGR